MKKILIQFAHPVRSRSRINAALMGAVRDLDGVTVNDLYASYPDLMIDIRREQELCTDHDIIIFQYPFYWYSSPSIINEWMDLVLQHGWAYGSAGHALEGKYMLQTITAGGDDAMYQQDGFNGCTINELLLPYRTTAKICRMRWLPPFTVLGIHRGLSKVQLHDRAEGYRRTLIALREETLDIRLATSLPYLNSDLDSLIRRS